MIVNLRGKLCLLISLIVSVGVLSQGSHSSSGQTSNAAGVVTGAVKLGDAPAAGITLALLPERMGPTAQQPEIINRAVTDENGAYRFTNVAAGRFRVTPLAEAFVIAGGAPARGGPAGIAVSLNEGQTVSNIDFTLARGGVITGRVTDGDGRPVIAERVNLTLVEANGRLQQFNGGTRFGYETDDRGVYRIYGLPAGRYLVSAGGGERPGVSRRIRYPQTYYPDVIEREQASPVEVQTDFSAEDIDIHLGEPLKTYAVAGRVIDADTGQPAPGLPVNITPGRGRGAARGPIGVASGSVAGADGVFRVAGLTSGLYSASTGSSGFSGGAAAVSNDFYSDPVIFEISGANVTGVEIKVHRGASIAGVVAIDGPGDSSAVAGQLSRLVISAGSRGGQQSQAQGQGGRGGTGGRQNFAQVGSDGSFRIGGVAPGRIRLNVNSSGGFGGGNGFSLVRVERNGAITDGEFNVAAGEQVTGVRAVVVYAAGVIQGRVVIGGGALPPGTRLMVSIRQLNSGGRNRLVRVDASGQFRAEGLAPGNYELSLNANAGFSRGRGREPGQTRAGGGLNNPQIKIPDVRQTVNVVNGAPSSVTLNINLSQQ